MGTAEWVVVAVMLLALWAIYYAIKRLGNPASARREEGLGPRDVHGALPFLMFVLVFLGPCARLAGPYNEIREAERANSLLAGSDDWFKLKLATGLVVVVSGALSIYAGVGLMRRRDSAVVTRARYLVWAIWPLSYLAIYLIVPATVIGIEHAIRNPDLLRGLSLSTGSAAIWYVYLSRSRVVAARYKSAPSAFLPRGPHSTALQRDEVSSVPSKSRIASPVAQQSGAVEAGPTSETAAQIGSAAIAGHVEVRRAGESAGTVAFEWTVTIANTTPSEMAAAFSLRFLDQQRELLHASEAVPAVISSFSVERIPGLTRLPAEVAQFVARVNVQVHQRHRGRT